MRMKVSSTADVALPDIIENLSTEQPNIHSLTQRVMQIDAVPALILVRI